ncbi:type I restriction enzyme HsdR N-terminal domain-containing protein [Bacteroides gallinaceum]|uniref:type I restriction enzyme HsdR N-terminal domain-containing protein n=1 Tax=Bacteroides gallinaceum TaxID=1462571 RepID=UPI0025A41354|nr:type I restriction enzyme HsdR N-terminal domain-containing protein [Bacteroides gallinaceum]MDM8206537.1 type I restriction enzyme HsdR N-terminal domain-containing protein [Bacteroides gallinaceum]
MLALNLPAYPHKIIAKEGKNYIFDPLRKKYVALTPEEWVRQHFVNYLVRYKNFPAGLLANEIQITLNGTKKRCDTVLYSRGLIPRMIVEYKAPDVEITQNVFDQITRYNMVLKVDYLIVTNGISHYCCQIDYQTRSYRFLADIPSYADLAQE